MKINSNNSIIPPFLKEGDQIEIVATAKFISSIDIQNAIKFFKQHKLSVIFNKAILNKQNVFAGTIHERASNINTAFNNNKTKAILFARGGYGSIQLIDDINFKLLSKHPKWLVGFSDVTTILMHAYSQHKINCIHGPMAYNFNDIDQKSASLLMNLLKGQKINIQAKYSPSNIKGTAYGKLIGGNLSILCSLIGSKSMTCLDEDYVLFIEDTDEYRYHLERMMYMLDRTGLLKKIKGLIVGQMTGIKDNDKPFGKNSSQLIKDIVKKYDYPVCFNFPIGHTQTNHPIIIGLKIRLEVNDIFSSIYYEA